MNGNVVLKIGIPVSELTDRQLDVMYEDHVDQQYEEQFSEREEPVSSDPESPATLKQSDAYLYGHSDGLDDLKWNPAYVNDHEWVQWYNKGYAVGQKERQENMPEIVRFSTVWEKRMVFYTTRQEFTKTIGEPDNFSVARFADHGTLAPTNHEELGGMFAVISTPATGGLPHIMAIVDDQRGSLTKINELIKRDLGFWRSDELTESIERLTKEDQIDALRYRIDVLDHYMHLLEWISEDVDRLDFDEAHRRGG